MINEMHILKPLNKYFTKMICGPCFKQWNLVIVTQIFHFRKNNYVVCVHHLIIL